MDKQEEIRSSFLQLFVRELIRNVPIGDSGFSENEQALFLPMITLKKIKPSHVFNLPQEIAQKNLLHPAFSSLVTKPRPIAQIQQGTQKLAPPRKILTPIQTGTSPQLVQSIKTFQPVQPFSIQTPEKIIIQALLKLNPLLADVSIQTVECPGPGKPVLVYKYGVIQTTNLILTSDEINKIMAEISEKTRIPLISGIFKAAWDNYIVTAVRSEFVGTRFVIQKKAPQEIQPGVKISQTPLPPKLPQTNFPNF